MELSVKTLRTRVEPFLSELGTLQYRYGAGLSSSLGLRALFHSTAELSRPEAFQLIREAMARQATRPEDQPRLRALLELSATLIEDRLAAEATEEVASFEASWAVTAVDPLPFYEAIASVPLEAERAKRELLEQGIARALSENARPYARRREAALQTAVTLGASSYEALRTEVTGIDTAALVPGCEAFLKKTEDAYRDVFAYALKRLDPGLKPVRSGNAKRHDLQRISVAPWLNEHFRREELLPSVQRNLEELGLHPNANGRIQLDTDDRPAKRARPFVAEVQVPDDVRLVLKTGYGFDDFYSLLHEYGRALSAAHTGRNALVEDRRLGDRSVREAWALLFDHFLLEEKWHRRYLRLAIPAAQEASRIAAFNELAQTRRCCARLLYERSLFKTGPSRELADEYEQRQSDALFIAGNKGFFLYDVEPQLGSARLLRASALDAQLHGVLQQRFDEDYWRNPATGRWLTGMFERGLRDDADVLAKELTKGPLSLERVGERLVGLLNR